MPSSGCTRSSVLAGTANPALANDWDSCSAFCFASWLSVAEFQASSEAAEERRHRLAARLAQDVPARHVDRRLGVGMALELEVHIAVERDQLGWIGADQPGRVWKLLIGRSGYSLNAPLGFGF